MAQRDFLFHVGPFRLPAGAGHFIDVAEVAVLHDVVDADAAIAVVVVIGLPHGAEGIDGDFVVIAEVVAEDFEVDRLARAGIGPFPRYPRRIHAKDHALAIRLAGIIDGVAREIGDQLAVLVVDGVPLVAEVPVEPAIGPEDERVGGVIVLRMPVLENRTSFLSDLVVFIEGEDEDIGRRGDDDLVAQDANAHRRIDVLALVERGHLVGDAGPSVSSRIMMRSPAGRLLRCAAIVLDIADPDPAAMIDIEIGRIGDLRLRDEERRFEIGMHIEILDGVGGIVDRLGREVTREREEEEEMRSVSWREFSGE